MAISVFVYSCRKIMVKSMDRNGNNEAARVSHSDTGLIAHQDVFFWSVFREANFNAGRYGMIPNGRIRLIEWTQGQLNGIKCREKASKIKS